MDLGKKKPDSQPGWTKEQTLSLISLYEECSCLYDPRDPDFKNRVKKNEKYVYICKCNQLMQIRPTATVADIKMKIKTLCTQLSKERTKIKSSKKSGSGLDDIYKPKLWCYEQLKFMENCADGSQGASNISFPSTNAPDIMEAENQQSGGINETMESEPVVIEEQNSAELQTMTSGQIMEPIRQNTEQRHITHKKNKSEIRGQAIEALKSVSEFVDHWSKSSGEIEKFCDCLATDMKQIHFKKNLNALKVDIFNLVHRYIRKDEEDREYEINQPSKKFNRLPSPPSYRVNYPGRRTHTNSEIESEFEGRRTRYTSVPSPPTYGISPGSSNDFPESESGFLTPELKQCSSSTLYSSPIGKPTKEIYESSRSTDYYNLSGDYLTRLGPSYYSTPTKNIHQASTSTVVSEIGNVANLNKIHGTLSSSCDYSARPIYSTTTSGTEGKENLNPRSRTSSLGSGFKWSPDQVQTNIRRPPQQDSLPSHKFPQESEINPEKEFRHKKLYKPKFNVTNVQILKESNNSEVSPFATDEHFSPDN